MLTLLSQIISPIANLIDSIHTSPEEKKSLQVELKRIEAEVGIRLLDHEREKIKAQASIVMAEAQGNSWLQRNWRPITMLVFLLMVLLDSFGILSNPLNQEIWLLFQIGLGGYVVGRSGEKMAKNWKKDNG